ncbi:hypothetical protein EA772_01350 [Pedobacter sp. G11]|nr:hypothetical protein EA772_01350 [Pedobacter sp. G11]
MAVAPNIPLAHLSSFGNIKRINMGSLDIVMHNANTVSIKDLEHNLDIADSKWDKLITLLHIKCEIVFSQGLG